MPKLLSDRMGKIMTNHWIWGFGMLWGFRFSDKLVRFDMHRNNFWSKNICSGNLRYGECLVCGWFTHWTRPCSSMFHVPWLSCQRVKQMYPEAEPLGYGKWPIYRWSVMISPQFSSEKGDFPEEKWARSTCNIPATLGTSSRTLQCEAPKICLLV